MNATGSPPPAGASAGSAPFGSALSVSEFAALSGAGVSPLGAVMGCDLQELYINLILPVRPRLVNRGPARPYGSSVTYGRRYENDVVAIGQLDGFVNDSRHKVLAHLRDEASAFGADAVIGIRQVPTPAAKGLWSELEGRHPDRHNVTLGYRRTLDYQLIGTAVRDPEFGSSEPRLTTVSPVAFCKLREAGWRPVGIVGGCSHQFGANVRPGPTATEIAGATALWETPEPTLSRRSLRR
jgi:hypothetical protein